jgi:predicted N-acetyltransferase YhbS
MAARDLDFAVAQTAREGWASARSMFENHLAHDPDGCFVAEEAGRQVGMVTTTRYRHGAWIGNLIVEPASRSRGIGRALMRRGLDRLEGSGVATVRLDGDPPGIPLYRDLGFVDEWESLRFAGVATPGPGSGNVAALDSGDLESVAALDAEAFGDDRRRWLRLQLRHARSAFVLRQGGTVTGYLLVGPSDRGLRIGPWVARDATAAVRLLRAARRTSEPGQPLTLGVPAPNGAARELLLASGFEPTPSSLRMIRGPRAAGGRPELVFAIGGGAVG